MTNVDIAAPRQDFMAVIAQEIQAEADAIRESPRVPIEYAPPAVRAQAIAEADQLVQLAGITTVDQSTPSLIGKITSEAIALEYTTAAAEIEAMGAELIEAARRCEEMSRGVLDCFGELQAVAASYREHGRRLSCKIEEVTTATKQVRETCAAFRQQVAATPAVSP
jgi:hypothetical protein